MGIEPGEIMDRYRYRWQVRGPLLAAMARVQTHYNGEIVVPLVDMDRELLPAMPNLLKKGVDQKAARIASTSPTLFCPSRDPVKKREVDAAEKRRKAILGWWEMNELTTIKAARRARHLIGYAAAPVNLRWDFGRGVPEWQILDPLNTFPAPSRDPDCMTPDDVIFTYSQSRKWLSDHYPDQAAYMLDPKTYRPDQKIVVLEYIDDAERVLICTGSKAFEDMNSVSFGQHPVVVLERLPNRANMCTAITPGMPSLDRPAGDFDGMIGMYQMANRLMGLEVIAAEKYVFPDLVMIGQNGQEARLVGGKWFDGRTGNINSLVDGDIKEIGGGPGFQTNAMVDRLERSSRIEGGVPAELGGESTSNIRTGRRGDAVLSAALDFPLGEAQKTFASSHQKENKVAIALNLGYAPNRPTSYYVNWKGAKGNIEFTPADLFTTDENIVQFAHAGTDLQSMTIMAGQLLGADVVSTDWVREALPVIDDPEKEKDRIVAQKLDAMLLQTLETMIQAQQVTAVDVAWFNQQVKSNTLEPDEAMIKLDERIRQRQASTPPTPGTPDAMAGLATGTPAAQQLAPTVPDGSGTSLDNMSGLMQRIRSVARPVPIAKAG